MRINGYYKSLIYPPAPFIDAFLICERLGIKGEINFLIDTGAAVTLLLDKDVVAISGVDGVSALFYAVRNWDQRKTAHKM